MSTAVVFQQMLMIFILIGVGYLVFKKGWCGQSSSKDLSFLITMVCNPAIMLSSAFDETTTITRHDVLVTAGVSAVVFFGLIILGFILPVILRAPKEESRFYNLMTVYGNLGFIGIPVVSAVLGTSAVIYVTIFVFFFNILIYTHGIFVLKPSVKKDEGPFWKKFFNIGTIAGIATIIIFWFKIPMPRLFTESISYMGRCTTFLSMLVLGATLANMRIRDIFTVPR
ncbi:MAG: hypothetical protein EOM18_10180, partial [Clostridia bacterium]|nr:hypothetical protein [Clostridia bacterium]